MDKAPCHVVASTTNVCAWWKGKSAARVLHAATTTADLPRIPALRTLASRSPLEKHGENRSAALQLVQRVDTCATSAQARHTIIAGSPSTLPPSNFQARTFHQPPPTNGCHYPGFADSRIIGCRSYPYLCGASGHAAKSAPPLSHFRLHLSRYNKMRLAMFQRSFSRSSRLLQALILLFSLPGCTYCH